MTGSGQKELPQYLVDAYLLAFDAWLSNPTDCTVELKAVTLHDIYVWRHNYDRRIHAPRRTLSRIPITDRRRPHRHQRNLN